MGQLAQPDDTKDIQRIYKTLDKDNDGVLSKEELTQAYHKFFDIEQANYMIEKIFTKVDMDKSGYIDYSEWVVATINKERLLSEDKLKAAFRIFDKDDGGTISANEVK